MEDIFSVAPSELAPSEIFPLDVPVLRLVPNSMLNMGELSFLMFNIKKNEGQKWTLIALDKDAAGAGHSYYRYFHHPGDLSLNVTMVRGDKIPREERITDFSIFDMLSAAIQTAAIQTAANKAASNV